MSKVKVLLASIVWLIILSIGVSLYRFWWHPTEISKQEQREQEVIAATSNSPVNYSHSVKFGLDGFSGYALLRSPDLARQLRSASIKFETVDDGADYNARLAALADGRLQMAAFPIDALLAASAARKSMPATIVGLLDETRGADAILAFKDRYPTVDSLNAVDTRFVLVGGSPSETLFRVLLSAFRLDKVSNKSIVSVKSGDELLKRFRAAKPTGTEVFITWEPFVSQIRSDQATHVLLDTSRQSGYIVDAVVVSREYLLKNEPVVRQVLEAYFRTLYGYSDKAKLAELILSDATAMGTPIAQEQAPRLVEGIQWKNSQENFAHFGLVSASVAPVESMIDRIKRVLIETRGLPQDPTEGDSGRLFYDRVLREMHASGFHPGLTAEQIRGDAPLPDLSDAQWEKLVSVGTLSSPPLIFARGQASLTEASQLVLDELVATLQSWPAYYVKVVGNSGSVGDAEANRRLAIHRAEKAMEYLRSKGIAASRIRAISGSGTGEMSVNFVFGQ